MFPLFENYPTLSGFFSRDFMNEGSEDQKIHVGTQDQLTKNQIPYIRTKQDPKPRVISLYNLIIARRRRSQL